MKRKGKWIMAVSDLLIAALLLGGIYGINYLLPQKGTAAQDMSQLTITQESELPSSGSGAGHAGIEEASHVSQGQQSVDNRAKEERLQSLIDGNAGGLPTTTVSLDTQDWHEKFADRFTDQIVSTDTSYTSPNLAI